jgi:selenide,water dikinase
MKRVVLLGGGHSHIEVVRRCVERRLAGEVVLVNPFEVLPYTGMVPGYVAGRYARADFEIDLVRLCASAGVVFKRCAGIAIDPASSGLLCDDGSSLAYDVLSIDIGSVLESDTRGAAAHAIPVRPLAPFVDAWGDLLSRSRRASFVVVGAGAGGVELALAVHAALAATGATPRIALVGDSGSLVPGYPRHASRMLEATCRARGIGIYLGSRVAEVMPDGVLLATGEHVGSERVIWATGPAAPTWLRATGLALDERGCVAVDTCLRSISHANVFATGDVASVAGYDRPKSGVYAVRQGPRLHENLRRALDGEELVEYVPQRRALALLGTGDGRAVGVYGPLTVEGSWVWRWKDAIDRRFVTRYRGR